MVAVNGAELVMDRMIGRSGQPVGQVPVGSVILMHFLILLGGSAILASGGAIGMLMLLVALKTLAEIAGALFALSRSNGGAGSTTT